MLKKVREKRDQLPYWLLRGQLSTIMNLPSTADEIGKLVKTKLKTRTTRMHSSRMRTGRSLTICCSLLPGGGGLSAWSRGVCLVWGGSPCQVPGGLPGLGGFSLPGPGGCLPGPGGFSLPGLGGVLPAWSGGGFSLPGPGGSAWSRGGFSLPGPRGVSGQPPPCEQNHTHV